MAGGLPAPSATLRSNFARIMQLHDKAIGIPENATPAEREARRAEFQRMVDSRFEEERAQLRESDPLRLTSPEARARADRLQNRFDIAHDSIKEKTGFEISAAHNYMRGRLPYKPIKYGDTPYGKYVSVLPAEGQGWDPNTRVYFVVFPNNDVRGPFGTFQEAKLARNI